MSAHRLLITGASGFVGRWTLEHWREAYPAAEIWATSDQDSFADDRADRCSVLDLRDGEAVKTLVQTCRPTHVIHLAGIVGNASLERHLSVNVLGTENLYQALADMGNSSELRIVQAGTAAMYGRVQPEELPIKEGHPFRPLTAYAVSKMTQDYLAALFWRARGLSVIRARIFNLLGPGQSEHLVPATFIKQLRSLQDGQPLQVGNLRARRDFVDVRDVAEALGRLLMGGRPGGAYNVASGASVAIGDLLDELLALSGLNDISIVEVTSRVRANDVPDVYADTTAIAEAVQWRPRISMHQALKDMWKDASPSGCRAEQR
ncbi:MAG: GDP-mannose 4,6-dehydratase [Phycisphaerales bacterium]|nr:MAG: GDP-mannose 4,6-dehydratase [Phycisphaerales bacterium]